MKPRSLTQDDLIVDIIPSTTSQTRVFVSIKGLSVINKLSWLDKYQPEDELKIRTDMLKELQYKLQRHLNKLEPFVTPGTYVIPTKTL